MKSTIVSSILCMVLSAAAPAFGQEGPAAEDRARLAEAYRLAEAVQDHVWPGWRTAPFSVLLVAEDREFLIQAGTPPEGFELLDDSPGLPGGLSWRPRSFEPTLLATFPAFGSGPTIVIGRPQRTGKSSAEWVLTVLHEHFHQLQMSQPDYYPAVEGLGLSGDDQTGMWMLNYPFPYDSAAVGRQFSTLAAELAEALDHPSRTRRSRFWKSYARFLAGLAEKDRRYLRFQAWQEGVARYVELRAAEAASSGYAPSPEFAALADHEAFAALAGRMRRDLFAQLRDLDLKSRRRVAFYPFGAGLALLLDQAGVGWKTAYFDWKFLLAKNAHGANRAAH